MSVEGCIGGAEMGKISGKIVLVGQKTEKQVGKSVTIQDNDRQIGYVQKANWLCPKLLTVHCNLFHWYEQNVITGCLQLLENH